MKKLFSFLSAVVAMCSMAAFAEPVAPVSGTLTEKTEYSIPDTGGSFDAYYTTSEVIEEGKTIVVFYYNHSTDGIWGTSPIYFGPAGDNPLSRDKNLKDAAGNSVCKLVANPVKLKDAEGHAVIEVFQPKEEGATWCYVICTEAEAAALEVFEFGGNASGPVEPVSGTLTEKTEYSIPDTGGSFDAYYTTSEVIEEGKTIVVFYYNHSTDGIWGTSPIYFGPAGDNPLSRDKNLKDAAGNSVCKLVANPAKLKDAEGHAVIEVFQPKEEGATWCYVICTETEAAELTVPVFGGNTTEVPEAVPGQDVANAIVLTNGVASEFKSTKKKLYVKFVAENSGVVTMNLTEETTYAKWMEEGVMAYGQLKQNMFTDGNKFKVENGHTYYCLYEFAADVESSISYSLVAVEKGGARGEAILLEGNGLQELLGIAHIGSGSDAIYENKTTWFKLEKDGAFDGLDLAVIAIGGGNETEVALYIDEEANPAKTYAMGGGTGMLAKNSTVMFDINVAEHEYYIAITQDDANGTATFTFRTSSPGEVMSKAFSAVEGVNTVATAGWYKYAHTGDNKIIKLSGISNVYDENGGNVVEGDDVKIGFVIEEGTTIYFMATTAGFTLSLEAVEKGMTSTDPVIIDNENGATFRLTGSAATDTYRYMKYAATEDGTFMYATANAKVIEFKNSATVRDITNPEMPKTINTIQEESNEYGETYFIYKWTVVAGHTYAIEQGLGNNFGTVEFLTMFVAAEEGETINKAFAINLYEAKDLGRKAATPKFYKFIAAEAGDYTVSVQMKGSVKSYDAEGNASSISQSYSNGLVYHNETFALAAGESIVFSCEPSEDIEHINVDIKDQFIPNYYATVTKADETGGLDYNQPMAIEMDDETSIDLNNVWHGPVAVPAGQKLYVVATTDAEVNALYFASDETGSLQWLNKISELSVKIADGKQVYTIAAVEMERNIRVLSYGMACSGTFVVSFSDPDSVPEIKEPQAITFTPVYTLSSDTLTATFIVPATFDSTDVAVAGLNLAAVKLINKTNGQTMDITAGTGEGTYNAGDEFSIKNVLAEGFLSEGENTLVLELESWGATADVTLNVAEGTVIYTLTAIAHLSAAARLSIDVNLAGQRVLQTKGLMIRDGKTLFVK